MSSVIEVPVSSNIVNVLNFVIFDIVLISAVYHLTSDLAGRLNYFSLSDGAPKHLSVICPPLLGGGVCSTSRKRTLSFLFIRFAALFLIFAANLTIEGKTKPRIVWREAPVRMTGPVAKISAEEYRQILSKRMSCQVTQGNFVVFGELRRNDSCVYDLQLLSAPVSASTQVRKNLNLDVGSCSNVTRYPPGFFGMPVFWLRCTRARIHCVGRGIPRGCRGFIETAKTTYLCDQFLTKNERIWTGTCREVRNYDFTNEFWFAAAEIKNHGLYNNIGVASIMRMGSKLVKEYEGEREVTQIYKTWFWLCGAKVALVIALASAVMYAMFQNAPCFLNDERSLVRLLDTNVRGGVQCAGEESALYLHATDIDRKTVFWASGHRQRKSLIQDARLNQDMHLAEMAAM